MKYLRCIVFLISCISLGQQSGQSTERYPIFPECQEAASDTMRFCFDKALKNFIKTHFETPQSIAKDSLKTSITVIFEVDVNGEFQIIYLESARDDLKAETKRVFNSITNVKPATYNGRPIAMQFRTTILLPLSQMLLDDKDSNRRSNEVSRIKSLTHDKESDEYDAIATRQFKNRQASSYINIPLSHEVYSRFDDDMNRVGTNSHTAQKPYLYSEVQPYYDFSVENKKLHYNKSTWLGRKFFNEHLVRLQGDGYWFTLDIAADLQLGRDVSNDLTTYNNTRAAIFQGGLGKNLNFHTVLYESQGRFAQYFNELARSYAPAGGNPAIVPSRGIAKEFNGDDFDYPLATGYLSYTPSKFFNVQFGHGKNFFGDGYRSLLLSDNASPYPYFKLNTTFWKLKYTNTWMSLRDVRPAATEDRAFRTIYMANHYLSYNVTKRLNLGFFETVIWQDDNDRGFDLNYLNPVIFYRAIEFSTSSRAGNALIGLSGKYKWSNTFNTYAQLLIDEFSSGAIFGGEGSFQNKIGFQIGFKYYNAFNIKNLHLQGEYNQVRPYTYSHNSIYLNYGHNNQGLAHFWGANFRELIGIARYKNQRLYGSAKLIYGQRGFDFDDDVAYGGDIYTSEENRPLDLGNSLTQGNQATSIYGELELGFIINPATNLKIYATTIYRDFDVEENVSNVVQDSKTLWVNFGFRTDLFNWYYDY